jgi:hypothetical protein
VALGEDRDDSVGLAQLDRAQDNALIAVQAHESPCRRRKLPLCEDGRAKPPPSRAV